MVQMSFIDTRYGNLAVPDVETDMIGRFLAQYGEWAWSETVFVASVIADGARVLDVGAFVGTFGLGLGMSRPLGFLCCVEANPAVAPLLRQNIARRARCEAVAVEALVVEPGAAPRRGGNAPGNLGGMAFQPGLDAAPGTVATRTTTLADLRAAHGPFDLIKIDVEGMEWNVLQGDVAWLAAGRSALWIECNEDERSLRVAALLLAWGLPVFYFAFPSHNPDNAKGEQHPIFPWAFEAGLLAAPRSLPVLSPVLAAQGCILLEIKTLDDLRAALWKTPRWGMAEWAGAATCQELAALVGRSLTGQTWDGFLAGDGEAAAKPATVWEQLDDARARVAESESLLGEAQALAELHASALSDARESHAAALLTAEAWASRRLHQLNAMQALQRETAARLAVAEALAADRQDTIDTLQRDHRELEVQMAAASTRTLATLASLGDMRERWAAADAATRAEHQRLEQERHARQTASVAVLQAELLAQDRRARNAEHAILLMQTSTTWRLTAPVRRLVHGLKSAWPRGRANRGSPP